MSHELRYLLVQHLEDPLRKEPKNVGIIAQRDGSVATRFLGEDPTGTLDGRKLRRLPFPDVYRQWVDYWREEANAGGDIERLAELNNTHYQVVRGGVVSDIGADPVDVVADYLFTRFVTDAGFAEALEESEALQPPQSLSDELEANFASRDILGRDGASLMVPHPVVRARKWQGRSKAVHRPQFSQENGRLYVIETFDFAKSQVARLHDHAGLSAFMFGDLKEVRHDIEAISIVKAPEESRSNSQVTNALWMLEAKSTVVDWLAPGDREAFLTERERVARMSGDYI